jgi:hypothetical protein
VTFGTFVAIAVNGRFLIIWSVVTYHMVPNSAKNAKQITTQKGAVSRIFSVLISTKRCLIELQAVLEGD